MRAGGWIAGWPATRRAAFWRVEILNLCAPVSAAHRLARSKPGEFRSECRLGSVIGLEVHAQLATEQQDFLRFASTAYGAEPNTQANLVDLGYPGVLPVLNEEVVRMAAKFGLAVNATVAPRSVFARKNYFYPDLPKGYQISQFELPIVDDGELMIRA